MRFFSGFCLQNESKIFDFWLNRSEFTVAGFSYGAIKALEFALNSTARVDRLILLSPAFFNNEDEKFKRAQLLYFKKDKNSYINNFLNNIKEGSNVDIKRYFKEGSLKELKELLYYKWEKEKLNALLKKGVSIEVVIGQKDKIIKSTKALEFFSSIVLVYYIKNANHILKEVK